MAITSTCLYCERIITLSIDNHWGDANGNYLCGEGKRIGLPHMPSGDIQRGDTRVISIPTENDEENELRGVAAREIMESIDRQREQRARWPHDLRRAMSELAKLFPTMRGVPGTDPWDVHLLMAWMKTGAPTTGSWWAAMFLLGVWNPHTKWNQEGVKMRKGATGKFDLFVAMQGWDQHHIDAAMEWIRNPFFP